MNKKGIITYLIILLFFIGIVFIAVFFLYSENTKQEEKQDFKTEAIKNFELLPAVPSDAVALMSFESFDESLKILTDTTKLFGNIITDTSEPRFKDFTNELQGLMNEGRLGTLRRKGSILSLHYGSDLLVLYVIDLGRSPVDTTKDISLLIKKSQKHGLHAEIYDCSKLKDKPKNFSKKSLLMISSSETLVSSSQRHIATDVSVLNADGFAEFASKNSPGEQLFISNKDAGKIFRPYFNYRYFKLTEKIKRFSKWTAFKIEECSKDHLSLTGMVSNKSISATENLAYVLAPDNGGSPKFSKIIPSTAVYAVSLPFDNPNIYIDRYSKYLDAYGKLEQRNLLLNDLKKELKVEPKLWIEELGVKEVGLSVVRTSAGLEPIEFMRISNEKMIKNALKSIVEYKVGEKVYPIYNYVYNGLLQAMFGDIFVNGTEDCCIIQDEWVLIGKIETLQEYLKEASKVSLDELMSSSKLGNRVTPRNASLIIYFSKAESPIFLKRIFRGKIVEAINTSVNGIIFSPVVFSVLEGGRNSMELKLDVDRVTFTPDVEVAERDTSVTIPKGPFKVKNCKTKRTNLFGQNSNLWLTLTETNGKGIWGVNFNSPLCGRVGMVDYYENGKIQFIFASGSNLYIIDRIGRFVGGFPLDLKKDILLGPDVYDFANKRRYNIMVLHKDNTIEMYNLQGKKPKQWKGISTKEVIKDLPELINIKNKSYWVVRTSVRTLIYGFYGGKPVLNPTGKKMIRPDSEIEIVGSVIRVTCYDGRIRTMNI